MRRILLAIALIIGATLSAPAQTLQDILQTHAEEVVCRLCRCFLKTGQTRTPGSAKRTACSSWARPGRTAFQLKPNGGVRRVIGTALVQFQLSDPDPKRRADALQSIARKPEAAQLAPLLASIEGDPDATIKARKVQLANFLSARFADAQEDRITAIDSLSSDTSVEARSVLNQILSVKAGPGRGHSGRTA